MSWWTDDRVTELKKLWIDGHSANEIFRMIGAPSRNAVTGKLHRFGLLGKDKRVRLPPARPARAAAPPKLTTPSKPPKPDAAAAILVNVAPVKASGVAALQSAHVPADGGQREAQPAKPLRPERVEPPGSATVLTLGAAMCKWPIGDPARDDLTFCGGRAVRGPYCRTHADLAYRPAPTRPGRSAADDLTRSLRRYI